MPSWSSLECSHACHAGDRRFKSDRGCSTTWHGTQTGKATTDQRCASVPDLRDCLWVRLPPVLLNRVVLLAAACKAVVTKQARWATRGSIPSRPTDNMTRSSNGSGCETLNLAIRVRLPYGSLIWPSGGIWYTRDAQNVVSTGHASSTLALAT